MSTVKAEIWQPLLWNKPGIHQLRSGMLPVIALVGRPNVGKSTLFNYLTATRDALVADYPGLTRDRQYGRIKRGARGCLVVDTGGITDNKEDIQSLSTQQVHRAIEEADLIFFVVDARDGLSTWDESVAAQLRKFNKPLRSLGGS